MLCYIITSFKPKSFSFDPIWENEMWDNAEDLPTVMYFHIVLTLIPEKIF